MVASHMAKERQKKSAWLLNSHCTTTIVCTKHTYSILTNIILCWKEHLEVSRKFFFWYPILTHPEGCEYFWVWAQHIFLCLPRHHWIWLYWSVSVLFEELPNAAQSAQTLSLREIHWVCTPIPSQKNTFMVLKSCSYFHVSHNSYPVSFSAALSCSTFSYPVLFASVLDVWARVSAPCSWGKLILFFCTYFKSHHSDELGLSLG